MGLTPSNLISSAESARLSIIYEIQGNLGYFLIIFSLFLLSYKTQFGAEISNIKEGFILPEYDFIIIGAGSAGSAVSARLSENENSQVLVLECGDLATPFSYIPVMAQYLQLSSEDWQFQSEPQYNAARGLKEQRLNYAQGKVMGGSSAINYMVYTRGNRRDFDNWAAAGNTGWSYNDVLKYYLKLENNRNEELTKTPYHTTGGPLNIEDLNYKTPLAAAYLEAANELGYDTVNINGETQTGFMNPQGTTKDGKRFSAARAYLEPIQSRPNLHISMLSCATRIVIDPVTKRANRVEFTRGKNKKVVRARKEVILSAGALQSPKLLMLSGVGPSEELNKFGIPVIEDLPVGRKLYDHVTAPLTFLINKPVSFLTGRIFFNAFDNFLSFFKRNNGALTAIGGVEGIGFLNSKYADPEMDFPDIEYIIVSGSYNSDGGKQLRRIYNFRDDFYDAVFKPYDNTDTISVYVVLMRPKSYGSVTLKSADPNDKPIIRTNYYSSPIDMKIVVEGFKLALKFAKTKALHEFGATLLPTMYPACRNFTIESDEFAECCARELTGTFWHFTSTCKMGPSDDRSAVVDPRLRVYGIQGLRVVDASIMPYMITAHTNVPSMMIGEKAADMIKEDHNLRL